jgi:hypothetical protein
MRGDVYRPRRRAAWAVLATGAAALALWLGGAPQAMAKAPAVHRPTVVVAHAAGHKIA